MTNLQSKTALITGGAHRVGKAITMTLARAGANVAVNYFSSAAAARQTAAEAEALGVKALAVPGDVADLDQVQAMVARIEEDLGPVDILVNSASPFLKTPFPVTDLDTWHRVINANINGPFYCANAVAPGMLERGWGRMVNIVDLSAWHPSPDFAAHSVGKAGLLALTRQLAVDLAPTVRVNAVAPGPVLPPPDYSPERVAAVANKTLLERWGEPDDVADAVLFLVMADYITGEVITVDGGQRWRTGF